MSAPAPLRGSETIAAALKDLHENGYCVVEGMLPAKSLGEFREAVYRIARFDRAEGWIHSYDHDDAQNTNQRIWNLISRDPLFCRLVEHEAALLIVREMIGWPALLSGISANIANEHGAAEVIHADQALCPEPWAAPHIVNIVWCIDDFTAANGATCVAPRSHLLNRNHRPDEELPEFIPLEAPAGSMLAIDGRCWHHTGRNRTDRPRAGVFGVYTLPIYLPQENWYLSLNPIVRQLGSETMQTLLGFRPGVFGRVNGLAPGRI